MDYPKEFPEPTINGYGIAVNMGIVRTEMENGYAKQRKRLLNMPQSFNMVFAIPLDMLNKWQVWVNDNAYEDFNINLTSFETTTGFCSTHVVKFISDLNIQPLTADTFNISVVCVERS